MVGLRRKRRLGQLQAIQLALSVGYYLPTTLSESERFKRNIPQVIKAHCHKPNHDPE